MDKKRQSCNEKEKVEKGKDPMQIYCLKLVRGGITTTDYNSATGAEYISSSFCDSEYISAAADPVEKQVINLRDGYIQKTMESRKTSEMIGAYPGDKEMPSTVQNGVLKKTIEAVMSVINKIIEFRDPYTAGHQRRVSLLAVAIAKKMGFGQQMLDEIKIGAMVHDVGKLMIPSEILNRPGKLSPLEFQSIMAHPEIGYEIVHAMGLDWKVDEIVLQHHERLNGSGYPGGLTGTEITIEAKIVSVADVVEAIASHRPYRPARGLDKAIDEINVNKGILYDPHSVDVCTNLLQSDGRNLEHLMSKILKRQ